MGDHFEDPTVSQAVSPGTWTRRRAEEQRSRGGYVWPDQCHRDRERHWPCRSGLYGSGFEVAWWAQALANRWEGIAQGTPRLASSSW